MKISASAPSRISLACGGTDVPPFCNRYGGLALNVAINIKQRCELTDQVGQIQLDSLLYKAIVKYFGVSDLKLSLQNGFDGHMGAGLGSSGSAGVMLVSLFNKYTQSKLTKSEIVETAWKLENKSLGKTGIQDQVAAMYGGVNYIVVNHLGNKVDIERFPIQDKGLKKHLSLYYLGGTRSSSQTQATLGTNQKSVEALLKYQEITQRALECISEGDFMRLGQLMNFAWELKKDANRKTTNSRIDDIYNIAMSAGAWGGKIIGAGGNGYMVFMHEPHKRKQISEVMVNKGAEEIKWDVDYNGCEVKKL